MQRHSSSTLYRLSKLELVGSSFKTPDLIMCTCIECPEGRRAVLYIEKEKEKNNIDVKYFFRGLLGTFI